MRTGFKSDAEATAIEVRHDLGLSPMARLEPVLLLAFLEVPVMTLSVLAELGVDDALADAVHYLQQVDTSAMSAATILLGTKRVIIHNDGHPAPRQVSNLVHEAAHALLLHDPQPALDALGCRHWNGAVEAEADYLGSCLLIPGVAARQAAKAGWNESQVADRFGVSEQMARWRINMSGARRVRTSV